MRKVRDVLPQAIDNDAALDAVRAMRILKRWPEIVGDKLASKCRPDRFTRGTVWVAVSGSSWAQELRMMKEVILHRLHEMAGTESLFLDVRFGVRTLPPPQEPEEVVLPPEKIKVDRSQMTIKELAAWRLANWKNVE